MLHTRLIMAVFAASCVLAFSANAADPAVSTSNRADSAAAATAEKRIPREEWQKMTPEERHAMMEKRRKEMRDRWEKMTPEQRAQFEKEHPRMAERQKKWDKMTPEEREKMRAEREARYKEHQAEWEKMTPEQREKAKAEMKTRRDERRKEWQATHKGATPATHEAAPAAGAATATH